MIGKHHTRPLAGARLLPPAVPAVLQAVVDGGRRDPLRSWYAAIGVLTVVFVVVTSIGVISGRSVDGAYPIMVQPQGPALPLPPFDGASPFDPTAAPAGPSTSPAGRPTGPGPRPVAPPDRVVTVDRDTVGDPGSDTGADARPGSPATQTRPHRPSPPTTGATVPAARPDPITQAPEPPHTAPPPTTPPHTTPPDPPRTTPPTTRPAGAVTARYIVYSSWQDGFTTGIVLTNTTGRTQTWKLKLIHQRSDGVRVKELWNAELKQGGATTNVFVGGDLAPGATLHFGFNASKTVERAVRPTSCTINGRSCSMG